MRKHIFLLFPALILFFGVTVFAENAAFVPGTPTEEIQNAAPAPLTADSFTLWVDVLPPDGGLVPSVLKVELHTTEGVPVSSGEVKVEKAGTVKIDFPVSTYEIGTKFRLIVTDGAESVHYYTDTLALWQGFTAETYAYKDANGQLVIHSCAHISITPYSVAWDVPAEKFVNDRGISSNTDYLVWVSKKSFTVSVFLKRDYGWDCIKQIGCSIGAPNTPTVTGEFVYHQYQNKWFYDGYYVGPVMRFYGGYALHSTLINNDGTNRDARIGKQISHGCVRVLPEDIKWLTDYVPIGTKIYVTED